MPTFGERIAKLRTNRNLSQSEIAKRINVAKSTLAMYETNKREPSFEITQRIADFYNVTVDYLLTGRTDDPSPTAGPSIPPEANVFFYEWDKLSDEDKEKALAHIKFLQHLAEQDNKKK